MWLESTVNTDAPRQTSRVQQNCSNLLRYHKYWSMQGRRVSFKLLDILENKSNSSRFPGSGRIPFGFRGSRAGCAVGAGVKILSQHFPANDQRWVSVRFCCCILWLPTRHGFTLPWPKGFCCTSRTCQFVARQRRRVACAMLSSAFANFLTSIASVSSMSDDGGYYFLTLHPFLAPASDGRQGIVFLSLQ